MLPKFRAWHKELKEIFMVEHMQWDKDGRLTHVTRFRSFDGVDRDLPVNELKHIELMQWTGCLDKHRKEIFEGDIVILGGIKINTFFIEKVKCVYFLSFDDIKVQQGIIRGRKLMGDFCENDFKVVGNIYANPELLLG